MKPVFSISLSMALSLSAVAGCGSREDAAGSGATAAPGASSAAAVVASASAQAPAAPPAESFFGGDAPAAVKMKPTKSFAMDPGILLIQNVEGWSGGKLPGYEYMAMNKDGTVSARVAASNGVTGEMNCKDISTAAGMAPLKAKNLKDSSPVVKRQVGKNKFVAREGTCTADGPKGPLEIHFLNILRKSKDGLWHYAVLVGFPQDASPDMKSEAMAWARALEYNGENGYSLP